MAQRIATYNTYLEQVKNLDFIEDTDTADATVKAVLGILASRLDEPQARRLTQHLPSPLTYEKLRGHQATPTEISAVGYVEEISTQFGLTEDEAEELIFNVLSTTKDVVGEDTWTEIVRSLPRDWTEFLQQM